MTLPTKSIPLDQLHFDMDNPRYGNWGAGIKTDTDALDMIVSEFLVDDLLSSISANGYFEGEPLIVRAQGPDNYTVLEGNRRLASLLILSGDSRAASQQKRTKIYKDKLDEHKQNCPTEVPAIVLQKNESWNEVLAYLGTKHIVGPSQWDSYAKARWMAEMRRTTNMALKQIKEMIGDTQGLVDRMLEGFYVVEQAKAAAVFDPEQSYQRGRGSNPEFPFSWVYTALNLSGVRKFLGLDSKGEPAVEPLKPEMVKEAGDFLTMVFGNRSLEKKPVIKESRDIAKLSNALTNVAKSARLRDGTPLEVVEEEGRPMAERLNLLVGEVQERLSKANGLVSEGGLTIEDARSLEEPSVRVFTASKALRDGIRKAREKGEDGDE